MLHMDAMRKPKDRLTGDMFLMSDIDGRTQEEIDLELAEREEIERIEKELKSEE